MRLVHFSSDPVIKVRGRHQNKNQDHKKGPIGKPNGFWVSDESSYGWRRWATENNFRKWDLRYEHEVLLRHDAKILYLRTPEDIDWFAEKYVADSEVNNLMGQIGPRHNRPSTIFDIDWRRVAKKYHGIIITPYIWEQRLGRHMWYYGWDCASGCIWNTRAIAAVDIVKEHKVPRKPTTAQLKRKRKREMERMRKFARDFKVTMPSENKQELEVASGKAN